MTKSKSAGVPLADASENAKWELVEKLIFQVGTLDQSQSDGMTAVHWATFHGNQRIVKKLIGAGASTNSQNDYKVTPLSIACESGNVLVAKTLIENGANVDHELAGGQTMLMTAARTGSVNIVRLLIENGCSVDEQERQGQTALMWAAAEGHVDVIQELIKAKSDVSKVLKSGFSALTFAAREGRLDAAFELVKSGEDVNRAMKPANSKGRNPRNGMSALLMAVENGHFELALKLIELGADPNDQRSGFAPLHALTWVRKAKVGDNPDGDPEPRGSGKIHSQQFIESIVAAGADINLRLKRGGSGRAKLCLKGATPFLMASKTADVPMMKLLLKLGADPTIANSQKCPPLLAAAGIGVIAVGEEPGTVEEVAQAIKLLVELGADVNAVDENGETAMHGAAYRNYPETVELLARLGADSSVWNKKNKWDATPIEVAQGKRPGSLKPSPETIAALKSALEKTVTGTTK
jgi:ankyrin repeat protein